MTRDCATVQEQTSLVHLWVSDSQTASFTSADKCVTQEAFGCFWLLISRQYTVYNVCYVLTGISQILTRSLFFTMFVSSSVGYYSAQRSKNNTSMLPSRSYSFFHSTSVWHFDSTLTSSGLIPFGFVSKVAHHMSFVPGQSKEDTQEVVSFILKFIWDSIILTSNSFTNFLSDSLWKLNYSNGERDSHKLRDCFWSDRSIISCL